jgi:phosphohistidine phosphatase
VVRHAKADAGAVDLGRRLTRRGERDAAALGRWISTAALVPDLVVVSPATRARQTWECAAAQLPGAAPDVAIDDGVYDNEVDALLSIIRATPSGVRTLALLGHNPSTHALATFVDDGAADRGLREKLSDGFPTSAAAAFDVPDWRKVGPGTGLLIGFTVGRG